jgi:hypothetical protein
VIEKMLKAAVTMLAEQNATTKAVSRMDEAIERGAMPLHEDDFRRPMGATLITKGHNLDEVVRGKLYRCSCGSEFKTMNDAVDHVVNARSE